MMVFKDRKEKSEADSEKPVTSRSDLVHVVVLTPS